MEKNKINQSMTKRESKIKGKNKKVKQKGERDRETISTSLLKARG